MELSGTGQIDQLGDESLELDSLQDVHSQGVEELSPAIRQTRGLKRLGKATGVTDSTLGRNLLSVAARVSEKGRILHVSKYG